MISSRKGPLDYGPRDGAWQSAARRRARDWTPGNKKKARDFRPVLSHSECGHLRAARNRWLQCWVGIRAGRATRVGADNAGLVGAERTLAALANRNRETRRCISNGRCSACRHSREGIAALLVRSSRDSVVNQASPSRSCTSRRCAGSSRAAKGSNVSKPDRRISGLKGHFRGIDGAESTYTRSLVRGHTGPEQVRNSDGRDDQNDRHDDQQFDKRETLLLLHTFSLGNFGRSCGHNNHSKKATNLVQEFISGLPLQAPDNTRHTQFEIVDIDGLFVPAWLRHGKIDPFRLLHVAQIVTSGGTRTSRGGFGEL